MEDETKRVPPRSGDMKPDDQSGEENVETEGSTGALATPEMPPVLDEKGNPDIEKRD